MAGFLKFAAILVVTDADLFRILAAITINVQRETKRMITKTTLGLGLSLGLAAGAASAADMGAVDEPIRLAVNEWTGQHTTTYVAGEMLKQAGYPVEYVTAGYMNRYPAMADGEIQAALEIKSSTGSGGQD